MESGNNTLGTAPLKLPKMATAQRIRPPKENLPQSPEERTIPSIHQELRR